MCGVSRQGRLHYAQEGFQKDGREGDAGEVRVRNGGCEKRFLCVWQESLEGGRPRTRRDKFEAREVLRDIWQGARSSTVIKKRPEERGVNGET